MPPSSCASLLTLDATRKLVPMLPGDRYAGTAPLVGLWVKARPDTLTRARQWAAVTGYVTRAAYSRCPPSRHTPT